MNDSSPISVNSDTGNVKLIYILYLASIVVGVTGLVGVIMAYINKNGVEGVVNNHYRYQIRTFWISLVYALIALATLPLAGLGMVLMVALLVWYIIRCIKGLKAVGENRPVENVTTWLV